MDDFDQKIIKTLELLVYKISEKCNGIQYVEYLEDKENNIVGIFNEDIELLNMSIYELHSYLDYLETKEYINIENVIDPTKVNPMEIPHHFIETGNNGGELRTPIFIIDIILDVSDILELYRRGNKPKDISENPTFDDAKSILYLDRYEIKIARQDKKTTEHRILKHILIDHKDEISNDFYYSEISDEEFEDESYMEKDDSWKKFDSACKAINKKVKEATDGKINKFLESNSSKTGKVFINKDYINIR